MDKNLKKMIMVDLGLGCRRLFSQYSYYNNLNSKRNVLTQLGTKHALYKTLKIAYDGPDAFKIGYESVIFFSIVFYYYYLHISYFWIEGIYEAPVINSDLVCTYMSNPILIYYYAAASHSVFS